jgi:hypothetical protein
MHGIDNRAPALQLLRRVHPGGARQAAALRGNVARLRDDQAGFGALFVIGDVRRQGHAFGRDAKARHRAHQHAVGDFEVAQPAGGEQMGIAGHAVFLGFQNVTSQKTPGFIPRSGD